MLLECLSITLYIVVSTGDFTSFSKMFAFLCKMLVNDLDWFGSRIVRFSLFFVPIKVTEMSNAIKKLLNVYGPSS